MLTLAEVVMLAILLLLVVVGMSLGAAVVAMLVRWRIETKSAVNQVGKMLGLERGDRSDEEYARLVQTALRNARRNQKGGPCIGCEGKKGK